MYSPLWKVIWPSGISSTLGAEFSALSEQILPQNWPMRMGNFRHIKQASFDSLFGKERWDVFILKDWHR